ncbi:hypothetical protein ECZU29_61370 [Escherichia coli]|nr:hypothetical protein ECZU29_61370 [Escherichia coli]
MPRYRTVWPLRRNFARRPADFADAPRRWPPAQRKTLREKMDGVALILLPDSFPDKKYVM